MELFYIKISLNIPPEFSLGIYTLKGINETNNEFFEVCFGFIFFEINIGKVYETN